MSSVLSLAVPHDLILSLSVIKEIL